MATNNAHKLDEMRQILGGAFLVRGLEDIGCREDIPETASTLEGNALAKARHVRDRYGIDCFADDTGLEVDALGGAPGVYTARFGEMNGYGASHDADANTRCLLDKMRGAATRAARFRTVIALASRGRETLFEGRAEGRILESPAGERGFGYDPVFAPDGSGGLSFAQMGPEGKNAVSHRGKAARKLARYLLNDQTPKP